MTADVSIVDVDDGQTPQDADGLKSIHAESDEKNPLLGPRDACSTNTIL
jgi:hypothetical protein